MSWKQSIQKNLRKPIIKYAWKTFKAGFIHLFYPSTCVHCQTLLPPDTIKLCQACTALLELLDPSMHCLICFHTLVENSTRPCQECLHTPSSFYRTGAAFAYEGPAASLAKALKYRNQPYLAEGIAAYLVIQWDRLQWPLPDAIVPVPIAFSRWIERGYNQSQLIAQEMGKLLQCPVISPLKKKSGTYSQAALPTEHRKLLTAQQFTCMSSLSLENKTILLLDDVMTTGTTLRACAEILQQKGANKLYALTFCRTISHANELSPNQEDLKTKEI